MTNLLTWINLHNCGVTPCGVIGNNHIVVRILDSTGKVHEQQVTTYQQARDVLGY